MAPLPAQNWPRDPAWRKALSDIVDAVCGHLPRQGQDRLARLGQRDADALEKLADAVIAGRVPESDWGAAVLIAAALQTYWIHMSTALGHDAFARTEPANLCPVCASAPVASLVRIGPQQGLRYLHCSLCAAEWHMVRAKCSNCESTRGIAYFTIAGGQEAVKAESCEECGSYLKILYMDKDPWLEPTADDLATLALDILMGERGAARSGPNLFLISE
jgi:FdhE protein